MPGLTGFKNFLLRGNLVELAVALIMALAFTAVVTATVDPLMDVEEIRDLLAARQRP